MLRLRAVKRERPFLLPLLVLSSFAACAGCASSPSSPAMRDAADYRVILSVPAVPIDRDGADLETTATGRPELSADLVAMGFTDLRTVREQGSDAALVRSERSGFSGGSAESVRDGLAVLPSASIASSAGSLQRELALFQLHRAIAEGATDGLVLDCGSSQTAAECLAATDSAALHRMLDRTRAWGGALAATKVAALPRGWEVPPGMKAVRLVSGGRELLFLRNSSMTRFARGVVSVPAAGRGGGLSRAIELPSSPSAPAGRVIRARNGRIDIELALRPADAVLFRLR